MLDVFEIMKVDYNTISREVCPMTYRTAFILSQRIQSPDTQKEVLHLLETLVRNDNGLTRTVLGKRLYMILRPMFMKSSRKDVRWKLENLALVAAREKEEAHGNQT